MDIKWPAAARRVDSHSGPPLPACDNLDHLIGIQSVRAGDSGEAEFLFQVQSAAAQLEFICAQAYTLQQSFAQACIVNLAQGCGSTMIFLVSWNRLDPSQVMPLIHPPPPQPSLIPCLIQDPPDTLSIVRL